MESKLLDVFSELNNRGVVRMPGRRFPGSVIQGDTLSILFQHAEVILRESKDCGNPALAEASEELYDALRGHLAHYENVLNEHGMELPYPRAKFV